MSRSSLTLVLYIRRSHWAYSLDSDHPVAWTSHASDCRLILIAHYWLQLGPFDRLFVLSLVAIGRSLRYANPEERAINPTLHLRVLLRAAE